MRDPFRTDAKTRLIREAQVGLSVVAVLLSLFLYVAIYKISGRGRHLPEHVLNAPIAETVWPGGPNESGMSPHNYVESYRNHMAETTREVFETDPPEAHATPAFDNQSLLPKPNPDLAKSADRNSGKIVNSNSIKRRGANSEARSTRSAKVRSMASAETPNEDDESLSSFLRKFGAHQKKNRSSDIASDIASSQAIETPTNSLDPKVFPAAKIQASLIESPARNENENKTARTSVPTDPSSGGVAVEAKSSVQLTAAESSDFNSFSQGERSPNAFLPNEFSSGEGSPGEASPRDVSSRADASNESVDFQVNVESLPLRPDFVSPLPPLKIDINSESEKNADRFFPVEVASNSFERSLAKDDFSPNSSMKRSVIVPQAPALDLAGGSWQTDANPETSTMESTMESTLTVEVKPDQLPNRIPQTFQGDIARAVDRDQATVQFDGGRPANDSNVAVAEEQSIDTSGGGMDYHESTYIVREGDSYWSIAQKIYHDPRFFRALYKHNEASFPNFESLLPGTRLATPIKSDLIKLCPDECPGADSESVVGFEGAGSDAGRRVYLTKQGDTLFAIAGQNLGQASRYLDILRLNEYRLDPKVDHLSPLPAGVRLVLPSQ